MRSRGRFGFSKMMVADSKVSLGYRHSAIGTVAKLDARGSTGRIRAQELVPMLDRVWNLQVSNLKRKED
jgi:hypothetical protein